MREWGELEFGLWLMFWVGVMVLCWRWLCKMGKSEIEQCGATRNQYDHGNTNTKSHLTLLTLDMSAPAHSNQHHYLQTCTCIQLQLHLDMYESSGHMLTCTTNANTHPGLVDAAQKWSQEDGKTKKKVQEEKKQAQAEKEMGVVCTLAAVEKCVAEEYAIDLNFKVPITKHVRFTTLKLIWSSCSEKIPYLNLMMPLVTSPEVARGIAGMKKTC